MVSQMAGIATTTIQAPLANLVTSTMTRTTAVNAAPTELMTLIRFIRPRAAESVVTFSSRFQCLIIPVWLQTNETNTPMMYSWINLAGEAWKTTSRKLATPDRSRMQMLNA